MPRKVAVLGSTGSVGRQALEVIRESRELELLSIVCSSSVELLRVQEAEFHPAFSEAVAGRVPGPVFRKALEGADIVLNAVVGAAGLEASLIAAEMGMPLALANKESLVIGSELLAGHLSKGLIIPVDSEHSTLFRCMLGEREKPLSLVLTASGGSLRDLPLEQVHSATVETVLNHPTWEMGSRITVDSASMVNKAFEVIEARALFPGIPMDTVIHRSSIVHSLVECSDGAWKALMGFPDMKVPISWALHHPDLPMERISAESPLDWGDLAFEPLDVNRYPAFSLVTAAGEAGGTAPAAANAADEVAVEAFLRGSLPFGGIAEVIGRTLEELPSRTVDGFEQLLEIDEEARRLARRAVERICSQ